MNKGSNPVGVASQEKSKNKQLEHQDGTSVQCGVSAVSQTGPVTRAEKVRVPAVGTSIEVAGEGGRVSALVIAYYKRRKEIAGVRAVCPGVAVPLKLSVESLGEVWFWPGMESGDGGNQGVGCAAAVHPAPCPLAKPESGALPEVEMSARDTEPAAHRPLARVPAVGDRVEVFTDVGEWQLAEVILSGFPMGRVRFFDDEVVREIEIDWKRDSDNWRWPVYSARTKCEVHGEYSPCNGCAREDGGLGDPLPPAGCDCGPVGVKCNACVERTTKCARFGCASERTAGSIWCSGHGKAADAAGGGTSFTCDNLPAMPPDEAAVKSAIPEESEQPNDHDPEVAEERWARRLLSDAFEYAWERMAEEASNDPRTVARCKHLHDLQLCKLALLSKSEGSC